MKDLTRKQFTLDAQALKALADTGTATVKFAVIGVKDHDDDIMQAGAFTEGQVITVLPTHQWGAQPLGKGKIRIVGTDVLADLMFNMESQAAKEWHSWLKFDLQPETGTPIQEWSWGWDWRELKYRTERIDGEEVRIFEKVDVIEVSPVLRGAGSDTGTVEVKARSEGKTVPTTDAPWSRTDNEVHFTGKDASTLHHVIKEDGQSGDASIKACLNEIAVLNGIRAGAPVDVADKQAVYDHLAAHLKDAGIEAPALDMDARSGLKFADEIGVVIQSIYDVRDLLVGLKTRVDGLKATRASDGRELSDVKIAEINSVIEAIKDLSLLGMSDKGDPDITDRLLKIKLQNIQKGLA